MTKEELEKEAKESAKKFFGKPTDLVDLDNLRIFKNGYLASAEPREKRIAELQEENKVLAQNLEDTEILNKTYEKRFSNLEKENAKLRKIAEFQQSSNMNTHLENKKLKEGLTVGSMWNKHLNSQNKALEEERDRYRNMTFDQREQLTKAKEFLKEFVQHYKAKTIYVENMQDLLEQSEQFLSEVEK